MYLVLGNICLTLPVSIEKIILKCTQNRADRRYPKISLLISDLKRALSEPNVDFVQLEQRSRQWLNSNDYR